MLHLLIDARGTMDFVNDAGSFFLAVNKNISSFFLISGISNIMDHCVVFS